MKTSVRQNKAVRPLFVGQLGFIILLLICFAIKPEFFKREGGFSNYGVTAETVPFFTVAFLFASVGTFWSAVRIATQRPRFAWALRMLALLFFLVLISTYPCKLNNFYDVAHQDTAIALFVWETALSIWFVAKRHDALNVLFFAVQFAASVAALITFLGYAHLLFVSQFVEGAAFGALLVRASAQIVEARS